MGRKRRPITMHFYAYKPLPDGSEPPDTNDPATSGIGRAMFDLKTYRGAKRRARRLYGPDVVLFEFGSFTDRSTWRRVI